MINKETHMDNCIRLRCLVEEKMSYKYREVKCPWCDHIFMWNENGREGLIIHMYRLKETKEYVEEAKCPKCEEVMIVLPHVIEGLDINDERIETIGVRGI